MENINRILLFGEKFLSMMVKIIYGVKKFFDDYVGKWFVFFLYSGDFILVCIIEFVVFVKKVEEFKKLNSELIGFLVD